MKRKENYLSDSYYIAMMGYFAIFMNLFGNPVDIMLLLYLSCDN